MMGLGLSSLVGCVAKVEMVERVFMKCYGCNIQGGDSDPADRRLRPGVFTVAGHRVGRLMAGV
jgi:hypothetical protein